VKRLCCIFFVAWLAQLPVRADYTTVVNPRTTWGTWEGWGVSLCWWANVFGTRDDLADLVFTTNYTTFNGASLPGLGMNIARYNAGACNTNPVDGSAIQLSTNMPDFKQMFGYWVNWFSSDPTSSSWDWNGDVNQRTMLQKAAVRGANLLELFSNSPIWWMCDNHDPSGSDDGTDDNLQSWNYQAHAVYLATIAAYASNHWGIVFDSVEPFNEPSADWWTATGTQEGCHFDTNTQATVIGYLRSELDSQGLTATRVAASDESYYDQATTTWNSFNAATQAQIGQVNVHGYQYGGGRRDLLYDAVAGQRLWNSEYGESDGTGVSLASNLNLDFRWLHPTAWCYWQAFDSGGWGLIQSNPGDHWIGPANMKYFVLAQYTRHIRPGMVIIDGGEANTIAAYDAASRKLVIITMNYDVAQNITYDLSAFYAAAGPIQRWMTATGNGIEYAAASSPVLLEKQFTVAYSTNTIQTFEVQNVDVNPPPVLSCIASPASGQISLAWPLSAAGYHLYVSSNLAATGWQRVTNPPSTNGSYLLTRPVKALGGQFFRLANP
jgi:galactan endo-1,6-beta-galactosidase